MTNEKTDEGLLDTIETLLAEVIAGLEDEVGSGLGRPRVLPALALWAGMLVCVARGFSSQLELWRLLTQKGVWDFPRFCLTDDAIYKRLKHTGAEKLYTIFLSVTRLLKTRQPVPAAESQLLAPFASGVYALDEMTLDSVKKRLPSLRQIAGAVLPGKLTTLFDVRAQLWQRLQFQEKVKQNEKVAAREMLDSLPLGSLILADLGYFAFAWFDDLTDQGHFWISRLRAKTSYRLLQTLYEGAGVLDAIVWLGAWRADRAAHAVRLVRYTHHGKTYTYLTNVLDPALLSMVQISQLYARRWDIEMMFNLVKTHLHLHVLWSSHTNVVLQQVYAVFTVAQVILGLRADIASQAQADVFDVSLDLLIRWLPRFAQDGDDPVKIIVERGRAAKIIRPSTRKKSHAPTIPLSAYTTLPPDTLLLRTARHSGDR
jgi:hypothetical protein